MSNSKNVSTTLRYEKELKNRLDRIARNTWEITGKKISRGAVIRAALIKALPELEKNPEEVIKGL